MNKNQKHIIKLSPRQRVQLQDITKRGNNNARVIIRARVLLESEKGISAVKAAHIARITERTVERIRARFSEGGMNRALYDAPRSGQPAKIDDATEAHLIALACSDPPKTHERWTLELLQKKLKQDKKKIVSAVAIWNHLTHRNIKPWREKNVVYS